MGAPRNPGKNQPSRGPTPGTVNADGFRTARKTLQINLRAGAFGFDDAIHEEAGDAGGGQNGKKTRAKIAVRSFVYHRVG